MSDARYAFVASDLNRCTSDERFAYARCLSCGTLFLDRAPVEMGRYYPNDYYDLPSLRELDELAKHEQFKVEMLLDHTSPGRLVEIGPGVGAFARAARDAGFEVSAIEMDARACQYLRRVVGVHAIESGAPEDVLPGLPPSRAIVLWHVLEHLPNPWEVVRQAALNLEAGGVLAIAVPNPQALQFRLLRRRWAHLDAPRHQFLIPAETLASHCSRSQLRLLSTTTSDEGGLRCNRFGWDYVLRRAPRSEAGTRMQGALAGLISRWVSPIETHGHNGCAYTSIFVKSQVG
jgi:SAM-dependent methyltransferase